jgi:hypothetical protein|eukprot:scaffold139_cov199-Alexandrium_tamarense.AAC.4
MERWRGGCLADGRCGGDGREDVADPPAGGRARRWYLKFPQRSYLISTKELILIIVSLDTCITNEVTWLELLAAYRETRGLSIGVRLEIRNHVLMMWCVVFNGDENFNTYYFRPEISLPGTLYPFSRNA